MVYLIGAFLILTGVRFVCANHEAPRLETNPAVRLAKRFYPVNEGYERHAFWVDRGGRRIVTPLFLVLLLIESTDHLFAVDSIPSIYAVTDDPFIAFTSNIFAIVGLLALSFVLAGYRTGLADLRSALAALLVFVGAKMVLIDLYEVPRSFRSSSSR